MKNFILAIDQGTTSSRSIIFDKHGNLSNQSQLEFAQLFPFPGWVEHDPEDIWKSQLSTVKDVLSKINLSELAAIGITNQRETAIIWDRETGIPVYNAIVWQDRRTAGYCDQLKESGYLDLFRDKTGLIIDSYFSATKIKWILDNVSGARQKAEDGKLAFGTVDTWLIWKLTGGKSHITDVTNASRTMIFNIHTLQWDNELLKLLDIPAAILPEVKSSSEVYTQTDASVFGAAIPVAGIAGDQQAATFGQMCLEAGNVKNTYGTGCFMLCNTGDSPVKSKNNLLTTVAWQLNGKTSYALEGSIYIAGAVVQWLRDSLGIIKTSAEIEKLASSVPDNGGVYFVPAFTGLGAPHWAQHAKASLTGLTRGSTAAHIARAALEGIAFQTYDVLKAMEADMGNPITELKVDGGAAVNNLLMQVQADILGVPVTRPQTLETTALGVAYLAGLAVGFWQGIDEIKKQWAVDSKFVRKINNEDHALLIDGWRKALNMTLNH